MTIKQPPAHRDAICSIQVARRLMKRRLRKSKRLRSGFPDNCQPFQSEVFEEIRNFEHPKGFRVTISGKLSDDAKRIRKRKSIGRLKGASNEGWRELPSPAIGRRMLEHVPSFA